MSSSDRPKAHGPQKQGHSRREFLKRAAVAAGGTAAISSGALTVNPRLNPTGSAEAIAPAVAVGAIAAGYGTHRGTQMLLDEIDVLEEDDPPDGLTESQLEQIAYDTIVARRSNNRSTIVDNENLINMGAPEHLWSEGKYAAIEELNKEESQETVEESAVGVVEEQATTIIKNLLKSWNESVEELYSILDTQEEHPDFDDPYDSDTDDSDKFPLVGPVFPQEDIELEVRSGTEWDEMETEMYELPNGDEFDVNTVVLNPAAVGEDDDVIIESYSPLDLNLVNDDLDVQNIALETQAVGTTWYMQYSLWSDPLEQLEDMVDDITSEMIEWVDKIYSEVQAGELDTGELFTPQELAELTAEEEEVNRALTELMALNIPVNLEREAEIHLKEVDATVYGALATTEEKTLETGTYDPEDEDGSFYLTYDVSMGHGEWGHYEEGIDGGVLTFTEEPFEETLYLVHTAAGETAEVVADDFEEDEDDEWEVDLSDQLEDSITEAEEIEFVSETDGTDYVTIQLAEEFEIVTFRDSDDEEHESADYERTDEPQDDENYITQEEWEEREENYEELIEMYEESLEDSQGITWPWEDWDGDVEVGGNVVIGMIVVGVGLGLGALASLNPFN